MFGCLELSPSLAEHMQKVSPGLAKEERPNRPFFLGLAGSDSCLVC